MPPGILFSWKHCKKNSYVEYLLDILLFGEMEEKAALIAEQGKEVVRLEQRISELTASSAGSSYADDGRNGTGPFSVVATASYPSSVFLTVNVYSAPTLNISVPVNWLNLTLLLTLSTPSLLDVSADV